MHALIAFEFELGLFALVLGSTGWQEVCGSRSRCPKSGNLAWRRGVAAVRLVFETGGRFDNIPDHHHRDRFCLLHPFLKLFQITSH